MTKEETRIFWEVRLCPKCMFIHNPLVYCPQQIGRKRVRKALRTIRFRRLNESAISYGANTFPPPSPLAVSRAAEAEMQRLKTIALGRSIQEGWYGR